MNFNNPVPFHAQYGYAGAPQVQATPTLGQMTINAAPPVNPVANPGMNQMNNMMSYQYQNNFNNQAFQHHPPPPPPPPPPPETEEDKKITMLQNQARMWQEQKRLAEEQDRQRKQQEDEILKRLAQTDLEVKQCLDEEQQFLEQYDSWRKQFSDWKEQNKNHPDKDQYKQYEEQWKQYEVQMDQQKAELAIRRQHIIDRNRHVIDQPAHSQPQQQQHAYYTQPRHPGPPGPPQSHVPSLMSQEVRPLMSQEMRPPLRHNQPRMPMERHVRPPAPDPRGQGPRGPRVPAQRQPGPAQRQPGPALRQPGLAQRHPGPGGPPRGPAQRHPGPRGPQGLMQRQPGPRGPGPRQQGPRAAEPRGARPSGPQGPDPRGPSPCQFNPNREQLGIGTTAWPRYQRPVKQPPIHLLDKEQQEAGPNGSAVDRTSSQDERTQQSDSRAVSSEASGNSSEQPGSQASLQKPGALLPNPGAPNLAHRTPNVGAGSPHVRPGAPNVGPRASDIRPGAPGQRPPGLGQQDVRPGYRPGAPRMRAPAPQTGPRSGAPGMRPGMKGMRSDTRPGMRPMAPRPDAPGGSSGPAEMPDVSRALEAVKSLTDKDYDMLKQATQDMANDGQHEDRRAADLNYTDDAEGENYTAFEEEHHTDHYQEAEEAEYGYNDDAEYPDDGYDYRPPGPPGRRGPPLDEVDDYPPHLPPDRFGREEWDMEVRGRMRGRPPPPHYWDDDDYMDPYAPPRPGFPRRRPPPLGRYPPPDPYGDFPPYRRERFYDDPYYDDPYERPWPRRPLPPHLDDDIYAPPPPHARRFADYPPFDDDIYLRRRPLLTPPVAIERPAQPVEVIDYAHKQTVVQREEPEKDLPAAYRLRGNADEYRERSPIRRNQPPSQSSSRPAVQELFDAYSSINVPVISDIRDLICKPKRDSRPAHVCLIVRGPPGAGKTYCSKLIRDTESANGGSAPRILNLDDYFMVEVERLVTDDETGKKIKRKMLEYEFEPEMEESYRADFLKSFKKTVEKGFFSFIIVDAVNDKVKHFEEFAHFAKTKGFHVYIVDVMADAQTCFSRNTHNRTLKDIEQIIEDWENTPPYFNKIDIRGLLQDDAISDVEMEDRENKSSSSSDDSSDNDDDLIQVAQKSKWEMEGDEQKLDKLDGLLHKKHDEHRNMEDFLSLADYEMKTNDGKKHVRWADIEEKRLQERDREMGFVVGHTNWNRMLDDDYADKQLNQTKYI